MTQDSGEQDKAMISEEFKLQQDQINSLATSLQQVLIFLQDLKSKGNVDISNLSSVSQESIKYLNAVLNEFELLKQQTNTIKPGFILLKESIDKANKNQAEEFRRISEDIKILRSEQSKIYALSMSTKKSLNSNPIASNKISWQSMFAPEKIIGIIAIFISAASIVSVVSLTAKIHDDNNNIQKDLKSIQNHMGIKKKK
jgi:hypothetical protein